jgi:predicted dinucleotide-binding enzyme
MTTISIIGSGSMAEAIGRRAARHGHTVEIMSRDTANAQALSERIGDRAKVGVYGSAPAGEIVVLAVLYGAAVEVVRHYGDALAGKILIDITNPFTADATAVVTTPGNSISEQIAAAAPTDARVIKAFNTVFRGVLAADQPLDLFFAGGDDAARARVAEFLESVGIRPLDAGGMESTHALEWTAILLMGLARNGSGFDVAFATA